jgi:hypothetical protein
VTIRHEEAMAALDILMVADGERLSLGCMVAAIIARKSFPEARFHFAVPADAPFELGLPAGYLEALGVELIPFTPRALQVEGLTYRILNKVRALSAFGSRPVLMCDSDVFFLRPIPSDYLIGRTVPAATPEHGRHIFPWERLYSEFNLPTPSFQVLCGDGVQASPPWFNAGVVYAPNGADLGAEWERICLAVNDWEWVPERWPYLDQIALPLAMASLSPASRLTEAAVLDSRLNLNLFHWMEDQSYTTHGFVVHHHGYVSLIKRYYPRVLMWLRRDYPLLDQLLERYGIHENFEGAATSGDA